MTRFRRSATRRLPVDVRCLCPLRVSGETWVASQHKVWPVLHTQACLNAAGSRVPPVRKPLLQDWSTCRRRAAASRGDGQGLSNISLFHLLRQQAFDRKCISTILEQEKGAPASVLLPYPAQPSSLLMSGQHQTTNILDRSIRKQLPSFHLTILALASSL